MIGTKQIKETDHRIRLNDEELALICKGLNNLKFEQHSTEERKTRSLSSRLTALGCYRR